MARKARLPYKSTRQRPVDDGQHWYRSRFVPRRHADRAVSVVARQVYPGFTWVSHIVLGYACSCASVPSLQWEEGVWISWPPEYTMRNLIRKFQAYWLADASFVTLLIMLVTAVFVLPVIMEISGRGVLLFNILLLSVFFSGIFSTRSVGLIAVSAILFSVHLALRIVRFGENPYSFFVLENVIGIANIMLFIFINLQLLFRDRIVSSYRIVGAINVYLLLALMGALTLEVIQAATGVSIGGNVVLSGKDDDYVHFIYFSLASLTTVGFGDIYALSTPARMLATFLSTLGVLFPTIVIARLVGLASSRN